MDDRAVGVRFVMTSIITDQIGRQKVLSPTNHKKLQYTDRGGVNFTVSMVIKTKVVID